MATFKHCSNQKLWEKCIWCQTPVNDSNNNNTNNNNNNNCVMYKKRYSPEIAKGSHSAFYTSATSTRSASASPFRGSETIGFLPLCLDDNPLLLRFELIVFFTESNAKLNLKKNRHMLHRCLHRIQRKQHPLIFPPSSPLKHSRELIETTVCYRLFNQPYAFLSFANGPKN